MRPLSLSGSKATLGRGIRLIPILLLVAGCSPPNPPAGAIDLKVEDGVVFAVVSQSNGVEIHSSKDGGATWTIEVTTTQYEELATRPVFERSESVCLEELCFRTEAGDTPVWESSGAGEVPSWSFPAGRLEFLERFTLDSVYGAYSAAPRDIVADGEVILVAMGNDGILRRGPDGQWTRGVLGDPKPFAMWGHNIENERKFAFYLVVAIAAWATLATAQRVYRFSTSTGGRPPTFGPWLVLGWVSLLVATVISYVLLLFGPGSWGATFGLFIPGAMALIVTWDTMTPFLDSSPRRSLRVLRWGPVGLGLVCYLAFLAWSGGIISHHEVATGVAIVLVGAGLISLMLAQASLRVAEASPRVTEADVDPMSVAAAPVAEEVAGPGSQTSPSGLTAMVSLSLAVISLGFWAVARFVDRADRFVLYGLCAAVLTLAGVLYVVARRSGRPSPSGSATAGALASLVGGPAVGTMFALQPHHPRTTMPRITAYFLYIAMASVVVSAVGGYSFAAALILSPFTVPLADHWSRREQKIGLFGEFER
ncbi:MAG: hypothetical protein WEB67_02585 [Acidimicrobiia bacterium]